jgi:hypothetical protein
MSIGNNFYLGKASNPDVRLPPDRGGTRCQLRPPAQLKLRGLDPGAHYTVTNLDSSQSTEFSGKVLMEDGLLLTLQDQPASASLTYRKIAQKWSAGRGIFFSYGHRGHVAVIRS